MDDDRDYEELDWDDEHGGDCDCDDCMTVYHQMECGRLPMSLGGGCTMAGTEYCDWDCPFRDDPELQEEPTAES